MFSVPADECERLMEEAWRHRGIAFLGLFSDLLIDQAANDVVADFVRRKTRQTVTDPATAAALALHGHPIFPRRPCLDTGYYEAFHRDNVPLVDCLDEPIVAITERRIRAGTREIALDVIIAATGHDGLTGAMLAIDGRGYDGRSLRDKWAGGARSFIGLRMAGFPNPFVIAGPNGPSALANFILLDEQNADWICDCIAHLRATGQRTIEATAEAGAEDAYMAVVTEIANRSLMPRANTWYVGANISGMPRFFPIFAGGLVKYREVCAEAAAGYRGFTLDQAASPATPPQRAMATPQPAP